MFKPSIPEDIKTHLFNYPAFTENRFQAVQNLTAYSAVTVPLFGAGRGKEGSILHFAGLGPANIYTVLVGRDCPADTWLTLDENNQLVECDASNFSQ